ncbi:hypothetical protein [Limnoraphis robusta]|uniref:Sulfotransferase domain-containing protein n=1 Tax=Limnoraphis robusta CS-951 TaxID=1637645 RepID=A0A0F5YH56_9CYAN|nr:hypothetical protein [Limnoraphis robusta]KKD38073.1 hypothetical protein WN50_10825 [Limnoraphis robusta CS-951]
MVNNHLKGENIAMTSQLIVAAGMMRSGSTWLYNATRLVLSSSPTIKENLSCGWSGDWKDKLIPEKQYTLIKIHDFNPGIVERADVIVYSYRDVRDAMASALRIFGNPPSLESADYLIRMHEKWIEVADLVVPYDSILNEKNRVIEKLAQVCDVGSVNALAIVEEIDSLSYNSEGEKDDVHHKTNLFHPNHITDGGHGYWMNYLDRDLVKQIETKYQDWFERNGYPVSSGVGNKNTQ